MDRPLISERSPISVPCQRKTLQKILLRQIVDPCLLFDYDSLAVTCEVLKDTVAFPTLEVIISDGDVSLAYNTPTATSRYRK